MDNPEIIKSSESFRAVFHVSRETAARLERYEACLRTWQRGTNLVAPKTLDSIWHRHFADSAQLLALAPQARNWLDLGAGGGFPGLVIAAMLGDEPDSRVTLVESLGRKCAFLRDAARAMNVPVTVLNTRIEDVATLARPPKADIITARALAPLSQLFAWARPLMDPKARCLFLKGRDFEREILCAERDWRFDWRAHRSKTSAEGRIIEITRLQGRAETGNEPTT